MFKALIVPKLNFEILIMFAHKIIHVHYFLNFVWPLKDLYTCTVIIHALPICKFCKFCVLYQKNLLPVNKTLLDLNSHSLSRHSVLLNLRNLGT